VLATIFKFKGMDMNFLTNKTIIKQLLAAISIAVLISTNSYASGEVKGKAKNFTLKTYAGSNLKLSELRGKVVLLNFWASWCGPCRQEMPLLNKLHKKYKKLGFSVLGVNVEEDSSKAKQIVKDVGIKFPILFDTENKVSGLYEVSAMPSTVIIDRSGNMRYLHKGYKPGDMSAYKKWVKKLIRE
jgi:peroxiredoxin